MGGAKWTNHRGESEVLTVWPLPLFSHPALQLAMRASDYIRQARK